MKKIFLFGVLICLFASCQKSQVELNIMTFNVRYDNPRDSLNNWKYRKKVVAEVIKNHDADIVGTQEALSNQMRDLKELLPGYNSIGVGRQDGMEKGEYSAIFYKKDRLKEIKSGYFWLSETPDVAGSKGWDGSWERIATWAIFEDIAKKKQLFVINTHLDDQGEQARREGVFLLLKKTEELSNGLPVIITGDFNALPESDVIKHITENAGSRNLVHTKDVTQTTSGASWTFHDFGKLPENEREFIDYIFVDKATKVLRHDVLDDKIENQYVSDHLPVFTCIEIQ